MPLKSMRKVGMILAAAMPLSLLGGCGDGGIGGFDGVALNGKIFDAVGLNGLSKSGEPKMAARQPLVVPPGLDSLPPPGSAKAEQPTLAEIQDPDRKAKVSQAELQKQQDEYCKKNYTEPLARGDDSAESASGPLGSCHPSVFSAVQNWTTGSNKDDDDSQAQ